MKYIARLNKQKEIVCALFDRNDLYEKRYRDGGWTGKEVLIHIKDAETVSYDRLRRTISEEHPILWYFEQDQWQTNLNYMEQDVLLAKNLFLGTRESIIELVKMHSEKFGSKEGVHSRRGIMSMKQLIEFLLWHTDHHIKQIKSIRSIA